MTTTINKPAELLGYIGQGLGTSGWREVPQGDISLFADATGDHQWIHTDIERAASGPFGGPIAHGYLTLALLIPLWSQILVITDLGMAVNYGLNKVRFPAPVPAGSRIRLTATLAGAEEIKGGGVQAAVDAVMQLEGTEKPACVAQMVHRYYPAP
jgi:acyl dehydratase